MKRPLIDRILFALSFKKKIKSLRRSLRNLSGKYGEGHLFWDTR